MKERKNSEHLILLNTNYFCFWLRHIIILCTEMQQKYMYLIQWIIAAIFYCIICKLLGM